MKTITIGKVVARGVSIAAVWGTVMVAARVEAAPKRAVAKTPAKTKVKTKTPAKTVAKVAKKTTKNNMQFVDGVAILSGSGEISRPEVASLPLSKGTQNFPTQTRFDTKRNVSVRTEVKGSTTTQGAARAWRTHAEAGENFVNDLIASANDETGKTPVFPPAFQTVDSFGRTINLDQYRGKIVLLDFWATWCSSSRKQTPQMVPLYNQYRSSGFEIIGVSLDSDRERFNNFVAQNGMAWRQIFGGKMWDSDLAVVYGIDSIPQTVLLDRDGSVMAIGLRGELLNEAVKIIMQGR